jgi:nicotinate phosphoribosyltransferase
MTLPLPFGALFTDLYQLTMAQVYFSNGLADREASFEHYFRSYPRYGEAQAGYCVSAGLGPLLDRLATFRFGREEQAALADLRSSSGGPLFQSNFLDWLREHGDFTSLKIRAVLDGRVVHPHTPITVVEGPLAVGQLLETALLNHRNFGTLIATKASRVKYAALSGTVLEFGMRRAAGMGANLATEAALVGGADFSSNVGASRKVGLAPKGTHAHSLVQAFMALGASELEAFRAFARVYPDDCVLLVDTVDTLESGIPNAIRVFGELRSKGHRPIGIRLDSGDPGPLTMAASRMLDSAGFEDTAIVLSDRLDEMAIARITESLSRRAEDPDRLLGRLVYGVGTRLVTSHGAPSLDGVYKLAGIRQSGVWQAAFKLTDDQAKSALPGRKGLWRRYSPSGTALQDLVTLADEKPDNTQPRSWEQMLDNVWEGEGKLGGTDYLDDARARRRRDLSKMPVDCRRLIDPALYPVSLSIGLRTLRDQKFTGSRTDKDRHV